MYHRHWHLWPSPCSQTSYIDLLLLVIILIVAMFFEIQQEIKHTFNTNFYLCYVYISKFFCSSMHRLFRYLIKN
jgi:hypothetical protein